MISALTLEKPGRWRQVFLVLGLALALSPAFPLLMRVGRDFNLPDVTGDFGTVILRSLAVASAVTLVSLLIGSPLGVFAALYQFPFRRLMLALFGVPLMVPSFLWAIGLSNFRIRAGWTTDSVLSGLSGCIVAFSAFGLSLVVYATLAAARQISRGQIDAVRLAGTEVVVIKHALRATLPLSAMAGVLAGILTLSDPGPGQILGFRGVATEILVSFSAQYDFNKASGQCLALSVIVFALIIVPAAFTARRLAHALLATDAEPAPLWRNKTCALIAFPALALVITVILVLPISGLLWPLSQSWPLERTWSYVQRTWWNTILFSVGAGVVGATLGTVLALSAGRVFSARTTLVAAALAFLALPPSLFALGVVQAASSASPAFDPLLRSRFTVALLLGLRFLPIAVLLMLRRWGAMPPSWTEAAAVHGVAVGKYAVRVLLPNLFPAAALSGLIIGLLAMAEVGIPLLVQPPGETSFPVSIFTVMANAPEALVASLCLAQIGLVTVAVLLGWWMTFAKRDRR